MNKIISFVLANMLLASQVIAFSVKDEPKFGFTGYRMKHKQPVEGKFRQVNFKFAPSEDFATFIKSFELNIDSNHIETRPRTMIRDSRIIAIFNQDKINAKIVDVKGNESEGNFTVEITTNGVSKNYEAPYKVVDMVLKAETAIDLLDFNLTDSFNKFQTHCRALHGGKSWSDAKVNMSFTLEK
ncbi:MAG: YceI family protein [Campylobacter sp.]|nr:YceI family protein [Campylobacter sp.]